jgi:NTE family protein
VHLYDGGVYDNLGVEALYKSSVGYRDGVNFLIVSDAAAGLKVQKSLLLHKRALRLISIAGDQVRSLRARDIVRYFGEHPQTGAYLRIGNTARYILEQGRGTPEEIAGREGICLPEADVGAAAAMATTLQKLNITDYERLYRHGWEVADCTLSSRCPHLFRHLPYAATAAIP